MLIKLRYVLFIAALFTFWSCRSKKSTTLIPPSKSKKLEYYSARLGYEVGKEDNEQLLDAVIKWLGTPYKYNSCDKNGVDCSCLVQNIYAEVYKIELKRNSEEIIKQTQFVNKKDLREGDLLFFKTEGNKVSHVGIFLRGTKFVHSSTKKGVMISDLTEPYFEKTFFKAGRVNL